MENQLIRSTNNEIQGFCFQSSDGRLLYATSIGAIKKNANSIIMLLHGGGPDHQSLIPLAKALSSRHSVILPDLRGYGKSICYDRNSYTWNRYVEDIRDLIDYLQVPSIILGGAGIGTTIALKSAMTFPERLCALILISIEEIEDDDAKAKEIELLEAFATRVLSHGLEAAWEPILKNLSPVIGDMVKDAIPRSEPASIAAAAAIVYDRAFHSYKELKDIAIPTFIIPGDDDRHPAALAKNLVKLLVNAQLSTTSLSSDIRTINDFSKFLAPCIKQFINDLPSEKILHKD
ncbi:MULTISPECIES: alpha/beta fold hydrolase [Olivibacter]|uniref:Alpha/beta fold hydrolase n=1 Tax=Olivibacter oleidegradans TaxID=760123 RepID=A0ABV6HQP6_9SPHI|nr:MULTISPECIES: alpha/beta hydrolase [Olivibacter]QEL03962.1 alpha/beta hydrolase [Olivibacter sp. LS-1]